MNDTQRRINFEVLRKRATTLASIDPKMSKKCLEIYDAIQNRDEEKATDLVKQYGNANPSDKSNPVVSQMHGIRMETTQTVLLPDLHFTSFFDQVTLADNESPWFRNDWGVDVSYTYVGIGNKPMINVAEAINDNIQVPLARMAVRTKYQLYDLYNGRIDNLQKVHIDAAFNYNDQIDGIAYDTLTKAAASTYNYWGGAYGTFVTSGKKTRRSYIIKSDRIKTENLPTTNDITVGTPSTVTTFGPSTLTAISTYANKWGNAFADGPLRPTGEIYLPGIDIPDIESAITAVTTETNPIGDQILTQGYINGITWMGVPWKFIPDNTLAVGTCYPRFNKSVGVWFVKPAFNKTVTVRNEEENYEENTDWYTFQMVIPWTKRVNVARFTYKLAS